MDRYGKYFLQHILWLDDGFNRYYVQDKAWGRQEILDVESIIFDWDDDAEQWLNQCADHDRSDTISHLRSFLANDCAERYLVHRMTDHQVLHAVARQMTQGVYQIVIKPRLGWAVQVDADTATPALPLRVEPEPDLNDLLTGLKTDLNDLVAEQQKQYNQYEAKMRGMNAAQKALFVKQQMDGAAYDTAIGDNLDLIKAAPGAIWSAAKAFPGFYKGYLKFLWKVAQLPSKMAGLAAQAAATGDINPLKAEIDKIVTPVASTYEEAMEYKSMLTILCSEPEVYELLYDFAERYYEATHPIELAKMGTSAVTEVLITVLLAIFTAGAGAAANIAAKSGKLVKVFKLLKKITKTIKKISPNPKLLDRSKDAAASAKKTSKSAAKRAKGMPGVDSPKKTKKIDKKAKKEYGDHNNDGQKTTTRRNLKKEYSEIMDADDSKSIKRNLSKKGVRFSKKEKDNLRELFDDPEFQEMAPGADFEKAKRRIDGMSDEFTEKEIQDIKKYLFDNDEWAGPDPNNATAWKRLQNGEITEVEETLLKHERVERLLKEGLEDSGIKLEHRNAHFEAEQLYDFVSVADENPGFPFETP